MQVSTHMRRGRRPQRQREKGVVAILVGMTIVVMVGMVGLAIDLGQMYVSKTELQNSADACALAAARSIQANLDAAESAGTVVAGRHKVVFQDNVVGGTNGLVTVQFSQNNASGSYLGKGGVSPADVSKIKYVRCQVSQSAIQPFFIQALNALPGVSINTQSVSATAVARMQASQLTCALPVAICESGLAGKSVGDWIVGVINSKSGDFSDEYGYNNSVKWVDFSGPAGGASEVSGLIQGDGECVLPVAGTNLLEAGVKASVAASYNSRFGIYGTGVKTDESAPDFTGYSYTPDTWSGGNAYPDYVNKAKINAPYQGDDAFTGPTTPLNTKGSIKDSTFLAANGRDRRLMSAPVVDCSVKTLPLKSWACIFMLHPMSNTPATDPWIMYLEYRGKADDLSSPCASNGLPGGPGSSGPLVATLVK